MRDGPYNQAAMRSRIVSTGSYLPPRIIRNRDIEELVGITDEGIVKRTGIRERRYAEKDQATSDLATRAAEACLTQAGVTPDQIGAIIVSTTSQDMLFPPTACLVQRNLGVRRSVAFDIAASCSGFLYALSLADQMVTRGTVRHALVIGAEVKSRFLSPADPGTYILFGDGAGAVLLEASGKEEGLLSISLHADGTRGDLMSLPTLLTTQCQQNGFPRIRMKGGPLFRVAVTKMTETIEQTVTSHGLHLSEIGLFVLHQANSRIIGAVMKKLQIPRDKVVLTLDRYGNTSSSSIPIALDAAVRDHRVRPGELVLLAAFGGGLTWGSALIRW